MQLVMDMETRSEVDLKACGVYPYAEHDSTDIYMVGVKEDSDPSWLWVNPQHYDKFGIEDEDILETPLWDDLGVIGDQTLFGIVGRANVIHAHNVQFERVMWTEIMVKRYGFPEIPFEKWRCTAAKAATFTLPRHLDGVGSVLNLPIQKDKEGHRAMLRICKPNHKGVWKVTPEDFFTVCKYCLIDVESEYLVNKALPDITESELAIWRHDQIINDRGIHIDLENVKKLIGWVRDNEFDLLQEFREITKLKSPKQISEFLRWLREQGAVLPDLTKGSVAESLTWCMKQTVHRALEIRQALAKSSVAKLEAMIRCASEDSRARGTILYYAASTGRYGGMRIQPHNLPRDSYKPEQVDELVELELDVVEEWAQAPIPHVASRCVRGMLVAAPGKKLIGADYTAIEARGLAWVAGEEEVLESFRQGHDPYKVEAMKVFEKEYDEINDDERVIGKTIVLACGYQGWEPAFRQMGTSAMDKFSVKQIEEWIRKWRQARAATTCFWKGVRVAAFRTVTSGRPHAFGRIKFGVRNDFLHCRLPSGRLLSYFKPGTEDVLTKYKTWNTNITYWGVNSQTRHWTKQYTYGGKLTENIVQGLARDILSHNMLRAEECGYPVVLHVHDEIVSEIDAAWAADTTLLLAKYEHTVSAVPEWAEGMPISAEAWISNRYQKG